MQLSVSTPDLPILPGLEAMSAGAWASAAPANPPALPAGEGGFADRFPDLAPAVVAETVPPPPASVLGPIMAWPMAGAAGNLEFPADRAGLNPGEPELPRSLPPAAASAELPENSRPLRSDGRVRVRSKGVAAHSQHRSSRPEARPESEPLRNNSPAGAAPAGLPPMPPVPPAALPPADRIPLTLSGSDDLEHPESAATEGETSERGDGLAVPRPRTSVGFPSGAAAAAAGRGAEPAARTGRGIAAIALGGFHAPSAPPGAWHFVAGTTTVTAPADSTAAWPRLPATSDLPHRMRAPRSGESLPVAAESASFVGTNMAAPRLVEASAVTEVRGHGEFESAPVEAPTPSGLKQPPADQAASVWAGDYRPEQPVEVVYSSPALRQRETDPANAPVAATLAPAGAKFAAGAAQPADPAGAGRNGQIKTFLRIGGERVRDAQTDLGIDVAKSAPIMFASDLIPTVAAVALDSRPADRAGAALEPAIVTHAGEAVEVARAAALLTSADDGRSVELQLSVAGAELAIRVEWRDGEVCTTFRTDSVDLQAALGREWQAMSSEAHSRPFHLVPPVIGTLTDSASGSFGSAGGQQQPRDSGARPSARPAFASSSASAPVSGPAGTEASTGPARLLPTSLHLHTFA